MMTWVNSANGWNDSGAYGHYLSLYGVTSGRIRVYTQAGTAGGLWVEWVGNTATPSYSSLSSAGKLSANTWHHLAFVYNGTALSLYIDGVLSGSSTLPIWSSDPSTLLVGKDMFSSAVVKGVIIDELVILSRAADADEIRAIYESNAPVFAESATNFFKSYGPTPVEINEEGLFVRSVTTGDIFAVYGGGATKSWGGLTLGDGDVLIGRSADGYVHWDDSADLLDISGQVDITGNSTVTGTLQVDGDLTVVNTQIKLQVNTDSLLAGSAAGAEGTTFAVVFGNSQLIGNDPGGATYDAGDVVIGDELNAHVFWDNSAGQLLFRDATTTKLYVDTDGSLKAGAGAVTLDAGGLSIGTATTIGLPNRVEWNNADGFISYVGASYNAGVNNLGSYVGNTTNDAITTSNYEIRVNGENNSAIRLMANSGLTVGGIGDGNVFGANIVLNDNGTTESIGFGAGIFNFSGGPLSLTEISTTPATPTSGTQTRVYMKADKFVLQFNDGGTVRYKFLDLTGTGTTWTHSTTAP
jgi:hypothetical protein